MPWIIYCHTLTSDGRKYVGQTSKSITRRWNDHCRSALGSQGVRFYFANAIRKYGPDSFSHEVLQICETQDEANVAEDEWIQKLKTRDPAFGFNRKAGGKQGPHFISKNPWRRPEVRARIIAAINAPEKRLRMSEASSMAKASPEVRAKIASEVTDRWKDPSYKARVRASMSVAVKAAYEKDPELVIRIRDKCHATKLRQNAERTSFDCKVHGTIPEDKCYVKMRKGFRVFQCRECISTRVRANTEAKRAERAALPTPPPKTTFHCKYHGEQALDKGYVIMRHGVPNGHKCKVCTLARNRGEDPSKLI